MPSELVFNIGLIVAGFALIAGLVTAIVLGFRWRTLSAKLDAEYGKKTR